ncbi:MAG: hypothetical protein J6K04_01590 [Lachnospiraceae bacterium]|nr:hypothetical protein [Lachnospiraceae bacterium]MBP3567834.1 hypothetical protein [Lachnospiraceae bacterium]
MASLMLGIDFSKTDMQIGIWNEERTCADVYQFPEYMGGDIIPTMVIANEEGNLLVAKEALDYSMKTQQHGVTSLYGNLSNDKIDLGTRQMSVNQLFAHYLQETLAVIRKRFGSASIARIGITGERMTEEKKHHLAEIMESIGYSGDKLFFASHADTVLWYEICESTKGSSMTLDFDSKGMMAYLMNPGNEDMDIPYYVETIDYTGLMPGGLTGILDEEERKNSFTGVTELAIARKAVARLYVTGDIVDTPGVSTILGRFYNNGRRIFTGRSLYCLGACYYAVKEKLPKKAIGDAQIFHDVTLEAYEDAVIHQVLLLKAGTDLSKAGAGIQVILDDTREMKFQITDVRTAESINCTLHPEEFPFRENKTLRLEIEARFLDYETLVLKIRDVGFGDICPASYRVWEQTVNLG